MTVHELKSNLDQNPSAWTIFDVRTEEEFQLCHIRPSIWIPLDQLAGQSAHEIEAMHPAITRSTKIAVLCHHGVRSAWATQFLRSQGFMHVENIEGGIDAWSCEVDPSVPRY